MAYHGFDPEILQDFLTESGELLEELEGDLVTLESSPDDAEMLNQVFRALHTIKGSASFLALTELVDIAHAAESALNAARNGEAVVDRPAMDLLLDAVDTIKVQMNEIAGGEPLTTPKQATVDGLIRIAEGGSGADDAGNAASATAVDEPEPPAADDGSRPLVLPENKADLFEFLIADLESTLEAIDESVASLLDEAGRGEAAETLVDLGESLARSAEFFEYDEMVDLASLLRECGVHIGDVDGEAFGQLVPRMGAVASTIKGLSASLADRRLVTPSTGELVTRVRTLLEGGALDAEALLPPDADPETALRLDTDTGTQAGTKANSVPDEGGTDPADNGNGGTNAADNTAPNAPAKPRANAGTAVPDQTIRVEVGRLETLMNLVGELVLQKNRVAALSRQIESVESLEAEFREEVTTAAGTLDRVTSDIQVAVMRTRMQPLDKLFGKYPRLIRDLASKTGKQIRLTIEGGDTEVDKSVIEELGDPLVHLLRNSADHGLEGPDERTAAGKDATGTIRIVASHQGSHVSIRIIDDGRGINRDVIARKAVERGLIGEQEAAALSDREVYRYILEPGFSTASSVTDLSGRGVGMDVVRTNIEALKGSLDIDSAPNEGTTITIMIPLTVAIMPAMMVGVGGESYAIPLSNLLEIVRPDQCEVSTINQHPVLRLRDSILPLLSAHELFDLCDSADTSAPFAVVLTHQERAFALLVSELIGQQEIVIKPLGDMFDKKGPMSGATVRDDGGVSLIVDVAQLARIAENGRAA
ncbi:MAG: chemotaxis protein CheA [Planctomycetota bacterium]